MGRRISHIQIVKFKLLSVNIILNNKARIYDNKLYQKRRA